MNESTELASLRQQLAEANARAEKAEAAYKEQFRLYCEETKRHNATSALLAKAKEDFEYAANALTEHAEAVGVSPDHINYIDETTKAIISAWANKTASEQDRAALKAEVERLTKERDDFHHSYRTKCDIETKALHNELTAARALNDRLAGALKELVDQDDHQEPFNGLDMSNGKQALADHAKLLEGMK